MNNRIPVILFMFVFAFGIYLYSDQYTKKKEEEKQERAAARIFPFEPRVAGRAGWIRTGGGSGEIVLDKVADGWVVAAPVAVDADAGSVEMALASLAETDREREIDPGPLGRKALEQYGLAEPRLKVWVDGGTFDADTIAFGKSNPAGTGVYIGRASTGQVLLAPAALLESVDLSLLDLRNRRLVSLDADKVKLLTLERPGTAPVICGKDTAGWTASSPSTLEAGDMDGSRIRSYLSSLDGLEAIGIIDEPGDLAGYGLDSPGLLVTAVEFASDPDAGSAADGMEGDSGSKASRTIILAVGEMNGGYFASVAGASVVYELDHSDMEVIDADLSNFRRTDLFGFDREKATRIAVKTAESRIVLEKEGAPGAEPGEGGAASGETPRVPETWRLIEPFEASVDRYPVSRIISSVEYLRVKNFIDDTPDEEALSGAGLDAPALSVTIFSGADAIAGFVAGSAVTEESEYFVSTRAMDCIYTVSSFIIETIRDTALEIEAEAEAEADTEAETEAETGMSE